jgi:hypothetical protein
MRTNGREDSWCGKNGIFPRGVDISEGYREIEFKRVSQRSILPLINYFHEILKAVSNAG